jgi:hypothetical protein
MPGTHGLALVVPPGCKKASSLRRDMRDEAELGRRRARLDAGVALARHTFQLLRRACWELTGDMGRRSSAQHELETHWAHSEFGRSFHESRPGDVPSRIA